MLNRLVNHTDGSTLWCGQSTKNRHRLEHRVTGQPKGAIRKRDTTHFVCDVIFDEQGHGNAGVDKDVRSHLRGPTLFKQFAHHVVINHMA